MNKILLVFGGDQGPTLERWAIIDAATFVMVGGGLGAPTVHEDFDRCILILPGSLVVTSFAALPKRITTQVRNALPLLLEDQLATAGDAPHCVIGQEGPQGRLVGIVNAAYLKDIFVQLRTINKTPDLAVADYMLLPIGGNQMILVDDWHTTLALKANGSGFAAEPSTLSILLPMALDNDNSSVVWHGDLNAKNTDILEQKNVELKTYVKMSEAELYAMFAKSASQYSGINLVDGAFAQGSLKKIPWPNWRRTALLATAASFLIAAFVGIKGNQINNSAVALDKASSAQMAEILPGVRNLSHLRAKLRELRDKKQDGFLVLSRVIFQALQTVQNISVEQLEYDDQRKLLVVKVEAQNLDTVHALRDQLAERPGTIVSLLSSQPEGSGIKVVLSMKAQP